LDRVVRRRTNASHDLGKPSLRPSLLGATTLEVEAPVVEEEGRIVGAGLGGEDVAKAGSQRVGGEAAEVLAFEVPEAERLGSRVYVLGTDDCGVLNVQSATTP